MTISYSVLLDPNNPAGTPATIEQIRSWIVEGKVQSDTQIWNSETGRWADAKDLEPFRAEFSQSLWDAWDDASLDELSAEIPISEFEQTVLSTTERVPETSDVADRVVEDSIPAPQPDLVQDRRPVTPQVFMLKTEVVTEPLPTSPRAPIMEVEAIPELSSVVGEEEIEALPMLTEEHVFSLRDVEPVLSVRESPQITRMPSKIPQPKIIPLPHSRPDIVIQESRFSLWRVVIPIVIGVIIFWGGVTYIEATAQQSYQARQETRPLEGERDVVFSVEQELRLQLQDETLSVSPTSPLEDTLQIEFQHLRVDVIRMRAQVTN
ncbi:MAG: hypothetical protein VX278_21610, partial [Myxococcota bacterium]|nr:hypothetical protein [Myxococcota bacterium]